MIATETEVMARPKPRPSSGGQDVIVTYKADKSVSAEFKEWLEDLSDKIGVPVTNTLDIALKRLGESEGMRPMPRRRVR